MLGLAEAAEEQSVLTALPSRELTSLYQRGDFQREV